MLSASAEGRGERSGIGFWWVLESAQRSLELAGPEGYGPRRLFDNFIGRKRDVDGGVLAGLSCRKAWKSGRDKLTVTFQTNSSFGVGLGLTS